MKHDEGHHDADEIGGTSFDELLHEKGYLVSRGVRPLALVKNVSALDRNEVKRTIQDIHLQRYGCSEIQPSVVSIRRGDRIVLGFASHAWVAETLEWSEFLPEKWRARVRGMLLGYSPGSIEAYERANSGLLHEESNEPDAHKMDRPEI